MRVLCISACQTDRVVVYEVGKEYDIPNETYKNNKDKFKKIEKKREGAE